MKNVDGYLKVAGDYVNLMNLSIVQHDSNEGQHGAAEIYTHVSTKSLQHIKSPFDDL